MYSADANDICAHDPTVEIVLARTPPNAVRKYANTKCTGYNVNGSDYLHKMHANIEQPLFVTQCSEFNPSGSSEQLVEFMF